KSVEKQGRRSVNLIKITELTNQLGISSRTLRYYEQMGLIDSVRQTFEKYRYYDAENTERVKQIMVLRKMQIPIKDIIRIYESQDMTVLVESYVTRINKIDNEIETLSELKRIVNTFMEANFPYMSSNLYLQKPETLIIGSDGQGKKYFRSIKVSQLKTAPRIQIRKGELTMAIRQSNNRIPNIHQLITMHYGENYWFNGAAKYVMECLGEKEYDYSFFSGLTGDTFAQVYTYDRFRGDGVTDYILSERNNMDFIEDIFSTFGYASTFVTIKQFENNKEMYIQTLISYIDKGVPVIFNHWGNMPRNRWGWGVYVGYENYGKTLLYMNGELTEPEQISIDDLFPAVMLPGQEACGGWVFVGEKRKDISLADIYRKRIQSLPELLRTKTAGYCFGAEAFRAWADEIESGRFDDVKPEEFDDWPMYTIYVCNLATNSSCCHEFLNRAFTLNSDLTYIKEVHELYDRMRFMWNEQNGEDLEAIGGGFNITLSTLQDKRKRNRIAAKIREFAECVDKVVEVIG
ncbi:MAG TPA: MerR family transcriptional regulator, partial [Lachnospiraceae bacterium]|nr:MerR family transcriptional regulator [Lachnospiraceae bacterium]